jgi:hypothetical protein
VIVLARAKEANQLVDLMDLQVLTVSGERRKLARVGCLDQLRQEANAVESFEVAGGDDEDVEITVLRSLAAPDRAGGVNAGGISRERLRFRSGQPLAKLPYPLVRLCAPLLKKCVTALHLSTSRRA